MRRIFVITLAGKLDVLLENIKATAGNIGDGTNTY